MGGDSGLARDGEERPYRPIPEACVDWSETGDETGLADDTVYASEVESHRSCLITTLRKVPCRTRGMIDMLVADTASKRHEFPIFAAENSGTSEGLPRDGEGWTPTHAATGAGDGGRAAESHGDGDAASRIAGSGAKGVHGVRAFSPRGGGVYWASRPRHRHGQGRSDPVQSGR